MLASVRDELDRVAADGITAEELARGKGQLQGRAGARPGGHRLADDPARQGRAASTTRLPVDEVLARIDAVDVEQVRAVAAELLRRSETCLAVVGPYRESDLDRL